MEHPCVIRVEEGYLLLEAILFLSLKSPKWGWGGRLTASLPDKTLQQVSCGITVIFSELLKTDLSFMFYFFI